MFRNTFLAATTLATAANALYFQLDDFKATDVRIPSKSHSVSFTVSAPENVYEQGGSAPADCTVEWTDEAPSCWQPCGETGYYTRISPDSYAFAGDFSVDVWQSYVYELGNHNNATVSVSEGKDSFACSRGGQTTICEVREGSLKADEEQHFG